MESSGKNLVVGILAHVDAGKTTLAESILYLSGSIRKLGRVDHQDAFLDTYEMEKARGITIFSKQAEIALGESRISLLDTPGHVDFSAEMERTLQVLDYAILVISGTDGIQAHDRTLWGLLERYEIPVFLFVNKMDQNLANKEKIQKQLSEELDERCLCFEQENGEAFLESLAMCDEETLEEFLETGDIKKNEIQRLIVKRKVFPCFFGSALKVQGVEELLESLEAYMIQPQYSPEFGARVYKISRDSQGTRLTHIKVTGGSLRVKMPVVTQKDSGEKEKPDQLRVYSGNSFRTVTEAVPGMVCAVSGWNHTYSGQGIGAEGEGECPLLEPVLTYRVRFPEGCDIHGTYLKLQQLEEEEPQLHVVWEPQLEEIHVQVMGEIQIEILKAQILERFGLEAEFGTGAIAYRETICNKVEGVGHFEPLRHYAEVHLLLEPSERGSGLQFDADCSEDVLDGNWQRLVLTHLREKEHRGVLTGSEITDMKITLVAGRAHQKHTEGGDFRQATYRAVRQGLMSAESVLLEPMYQFRLELPQEYVGRAMSDISKMEGIFEPPLIEGEQAVLTGSAPVSEMYDYPREVRSYTRGHGKLFCTLKGYEICHNPQEIIAEKGYDPQGDTENPAGSVFCSHGAGFVVPWNQVWEYAHLERVAEATKEKESADISGETGGKSSGSFGWQGDKELEEIFNRTYGAGKEKRTGWKRSQGEGSIHRNFSPGEKKKSEAVKEYILVDGYNIIFAWEELSELARVNIESARGKLMDILCNYQGYRNMTLILVFDAYKVEGGTEKVEKYHNIYVVYTKEAETADQYIEKTVHKISGQYQVTVATSDAMEQRIIWGAGASRMSAEGLREEIQAVTREIRKEWLENHGPEGKTRLFHNLPEDMAEYMEEVRLGRKTWEGN